MTPRDQRNLNPNILLISTLAILHKVRYSRKAKVRTRRKEYYRLNSLGVNAGLFLIFDSSFFDVVCEERQDRVQTVFEQSSVREHVLAHCIKSS